MALSRDMKQDVPAPNSTPVKIKRVRKPTVERDRKYSYIASRPLVWLKYINENGETLTHGTSYGMPKGKRPGKWTRREAPLLCSRGYHATDAQNHPNWWNHGQYLWVVEGRGEFQIESDKISMAQMRVVAPAFITDGDDVVVKAKRSPEEKIQEMMDALETHRDAIDRANGGYGAGVLGKLIELIKAGDTKAIKQLGCGRRSSYWHNENAAASLKWAYLEWVKSDSIADLLTVAGSIAHVDFLSDQTIPKKPTLLIPEGIDSLHNIVELIGKLPTNKPQRKPHARRVPIMDYAKARHLR